MNQNAANSRAGAGWWRLLLVAGFCVAAFAALPTLRAAEALPRSVSTTRQFVVYAKKSTVRVAVGTLAEDTKSGLLAALGLEDRWKLPIVIDLRYPPPGLPDSLPPARLSLGQTGVGLKVELDLLLGEAGRGNRLHDEIVRALLLEMTYREYSELPAGITYNLPPPWLVEGLASYLENKENGASAEMFAALLPTSQTLSLEDYLNKNPATLDSTSRKVYRAFSFTLVRLLLEELPNGRAGLASFINDWAGAAMDADRGAGVLRNHFPELATAPDSLEKWWTLSLARLAASDQYKSFSVEESERKLVALLTFDGPSEAAKGKTPRTYQISDYDKFPPLKQTQQMLAPTSRGLMELTARANPLYRPVVIGYQQIVADLLRGKTKSAGAQLRELEELRKGMTARKEAIDDYMNWFEATQMKTTSGAFEDYFQAAKQIKASAKGPPRSDPVSMYLDSLEMEVH